MKAMKSITILIFFAGVFSAIATPVLEKGRVSGSVLDAETGEALPGANLVVSGTNLGTATDINGNFTLALPPGTYALHCSMIGYGRETRKITIAVDQPLELVFKLKMETIAGEEVVVEAQVNRDNDAILLKDRRNAQMVSDAVSAETMSRIGAGDAAAAMGRVTGATVVDGKYVYMRGLGGRYGVTQLNGATLPSADPDKQAVQMDIIPSSLLENIVASKTATPDKPGNFAGGTLNIYTRNFPDHRAITFSTTSSFNTQSSFNDEFLTYSAGKSDWQAKDDGTRALPKSLGDAGVKIPDISSAWLDEEKAHELDQYSKAFNPEMTPGTKSVPINQGYAFSYADKMQLFGKSAGFIGSLTYNHNFQSYNDGLAAQYKLTGQVQETNTLSNDYLFSDKKSSDEVNWSGMGKIALQLARGHNLSFDAMINRSGESAARYLKGVLPRDLSESDVYESRVLKYTERQLRTAQLRGDHTFMGLNGLKLDWMANRALSLQDEPDLRFFTNDFTVRESSGAVDTSYSIRRSIYPAPTRYFRQLEEKNNSGKIDLTMPLHVLHGEIVVKFGGSWLQKKRTFDERRFEIRQDAIQYDGSEVFFDRANMGINEAKSTGRLTRFSNYVVDATQLSGNYAGEQKIDAYYAMLDFHPLPRVRAIGGARFERTDITVISRDPAKDSGFLAEKDWLPSINLAIDLTAQTKLRAAWGRTLARPTFRELAPYASFEFVNDYIFVGNPHLQRTIIDNYDIRWERYARAGELYSIGGYYKKFDNPIERVVNPIAANPEVQFRNVDQAIVMGAEFEIKKRLDFITSRLRNMNFGTNLSLIYSEVQIAADELALIKDYDANASAKRPLLGQSDYVVNANLFYDNYRSGTMISFYYNIFGERLSEVAIGGTPDIYEAPRHIFDLNMSQKIWHGVSIGLAAKNLLNSKVSKRHTYNAKEYIVNQYSLGRTFAIKVSYSAN